MTRSIFASFLLFVALLVGVTSSNAQGSGNGVGLNGLVIAQVNVTGRIVCNPFGNPIPLLPNRPVVGVNVTLSCDCGRTLVGQTVTNTRGFFQITANASNINLFNVTRCRVFVPLPINGSCIFLRGSRSLQASLIFTNLVQTVGGIVLNFVTAAFAFLPF